MQRLALSIAVLGTLTYCTPNTSQVGVDSGGPVVPANTAVQPAQPTPQAKAMEDAAKDLALREAELRERQEAERKAFDALSPVVHLDNGQARIAQDDLEWAPLELARFEDACDRKHPGCTSDAQARWQQLRKDLGKAYIRHAEAQFQAKKYDDALAFLRQAEAYVEVDARLRESVTSAYHKNVVR